MSYRSNGAHVIPSMRKFFPATNLARFSLLGLIGSSALSPAFAQTDQSASGDLETIVVTAQRRSERLQDVPITITNISSEQLAQANVQTTADIVNLTPALRYFDDGPFAQPVIRGVGTQLIGQTTGTNVGTYVDGFYLPSALESDFQLNNVNNIEVLKGPQGTLFGRNTEGGAILVTTSKPSTTSRMDLEADYGSYNAQIYKVYATTGLTDRIAVDIAASLNRGDGYTRNILNASDDYGAYDNSTVRTGIKFDVTDAVSMLFRYQHQAVDDPTNNMTQPLQINGQPGSLGVVIPGAVFADQPNQISFQYPDYIRKFSDSYQLTTTADLNFATLTSYTQYRKDRQADASEFANVGPGLVHILFTNRERLITQELLLNSNPGPRLQWTAGAFFLDDGAVLNAFSAAGPSTIGAPNETPYSYAAGSYGNTKNIAAYADLTYQLTDKLFLTGGVRFSHDQMLNPQTYLPADAIIHYPDLTFNKVTTRAVLRYSLDDRSNVYASFSEGFKAGIWDLGGTSTAPVAPETIKAFEVGYKYAAGSFSGDLSTYYYDWKNIQVSNLLFVDGSTLNDITNAADSHIYGVEGQLRYEISRNFQATMGANWTHARYVKFDDAPSYNQCLSPACAGPTFANYGSFLVSPVDASGNALPHAPNFTGNVGMRYTMDVPQGKLGFSGNLYYTTKFYFDAPNQFSQPAYATLTLRTDWTDPSKRYSVAFYVDNVTNRHYYTQLDESQGSIGISWSRPITYNGAIYVHF